MKTIVPNSKYLAVQRVKPHPDAVYNQALGLYMPYKEYALPTYQVIDNTGDDSIALGETVIVKYGKLQTTPQEDVFLVHPRHILGFVVETEEEQPSATVAPIIAHKEPEEIVF